MEAVITATPAMAIRRTAMRLGTATVDLAIVTMMISITEDGAPGMVRTRVENIMDSRLRIPAASTAATGS